MELAVIFFVVIAIALGVFYIVGLFTPTAKPKTTRKVSAEEQRLIDADADRQDYVRLRVAMNRELDSHNGTIPAWRK